MKYGSLVFGKDNFEMIQFYYEINETYEDYAHKNTLDVLTENMSNALVVNAEDVPEDVVQIYSTITISSTSGWRDIFKLVPPSEKNIRKNKISVVGTLGASIVGLSEGDSIKFGLPGDLIYLTIKKVHTSRKLVKLDISKEKYEEILPNENKNLLTLNI